MNLEHITGTPNDNGDIEAGITVHAYDPVTKEYAGIALAFISWGDLAEGIIKYPMPANTTPLEPTPGERQVAVYDYEGEKWDYVADWRGVTYWVGFVPTTITERGVEPPSNAVLIEPPYIANSAKRRDLLNAANEKVSILLDAKTLGMITDAERVLLDAWKAYRVQLNRMDDLNNESPAWPTIPE